MDQREINNFSVSIDELESLDTNDKWGGYELETLYKIALQFFKGNFSNRYTANISVYK